MTRRLFVLSLLAGVVFIAHKNWYPSALGEGQEPVDAPPVRRALTDKDYEMFRRLVDVMDEVERKYVDKSVTREQLLEAAIRGVMRKLDPYSNYIPPKEISRFRTDIDQKFGGIGIQVGVKNNLITVISPIIGSPAYKAGVQAGDQIVEIEGKSAEGISLADAVKKLKGKPDTEVTFTIARPSTGERKVIKVVRKVVTLETVLGDLRNKDDSWNFLIDEKARIGYIRLSAFSGDTAARLRSALRQLNERGMRGLILDLRFNPGGLLRSAVEICDMFLDEGVIVRVQNRNGKVDTSTAHKRGTFKNIPMAVLVNRYSASASEVVSACLQDHKKAVVIGERTYGKASVQSIVELQGGGAIKLTTASYHRPNGENIHKPENPKPEDKWGVVPDEGYRIRLPLLEFSKLHEYRRQRDIILANGEKPKKSEFVDRQLKKATEYLNAELAKAK